MDSASLVWIALVLSALLAGASFVAVLVVRQNSESVVGFVGLLAFALSSYSIVVIAETYSRLDAVLYSLAFMVAGAAGGWSLASTLLERVQVDEPSLQLPDVPLHDNGTAAVIVVSCVEPQRYEPRATAGTLHMLADEELLEPSIGTLPFLFFAQKTRYRAIGGTSPARAQLGTIADELRARLPVESVGRVDSAACSGNQRLSAKVLDAVVAGHRRVVVAELGVASSLHMSQAKREVDSLRLEELGVSILYTDTLENSEGLVATAARRVLATLSDHDSTGVVLVGHGQPEPRAHRNRSMDEKETAFLNRVRMRLIENGIAENNVRIAWLEWTSPDVSSSVRHLAALGCERIAIVPAVYPLDTIATRLDLELAVRQARTDAGVTVVTFPPWREDEVVLRELTERVERALIGEHGI